MMKSIILLLILLAIATPGTCAQAQQCQAGLSCEQVPWRLPGFPIMLTPTPFPTANATALPTATATPSESGSPMTPTPDVNIENIGDIVATLQVFANATPNGAASPVAAFDVYASSAGLFGFILGLSNVNFGVFTPLISFVLFAFFTWFVIRFTTLILPIIAGIVGLIRKAVSLILEFLPL
ncbi:hypothetical protein FBR02_03435 [Anaerolineae bacterium CFX9]|nr:hypothetical protein [Anaerolineae bacterium CFX9]